MEIITCIAPVNIATIKYWGKRDEKLILPLNDSISVTLSTSLMCAKTTIATSPEFKSDRIWLNGREESITNPRLQSCINEIREKVKSSGSKKSKSMIDWKLHICSENNFPTAAGLASSAAGYACLVFALGQLFKLECDLSSIARRGSGSACRSIHGGFVIWKKGIQKDGSDSIAEQIASSSHWKEMKVIILTVNRGQKSVGSSNAMQRSTLTSDYLKNFNIDERVMSLREAILQKDFKTFSELTMKDSNRLHSICQDTYPPVQYLNDTSHYIIQLIHLLNDYFGKPKVAYSFDAGPNACLFLLEETVPLLLSVINHFLPQGEVGNGEPYFKGETVQPIKLPSDILKAIPLTPLRAGSLEGIIYTEVGDGPQVLGDSDHLLDDKGFPKKSL